MILGSGSASFEIMRYLVERLPVMITPRWVHARVQPIAVRNVIGYLIGCLKTPETAGRVLDIGGPDIVTYADLFRIFAEEAGLRQRIILPVPWFTPPAQLALDSPGHAGPLPTWPGPWPRD